MRASQFIDFINKKDIPSKEDQLTSYTHLDLEDERDEDNKIVRANELKKIRREYRSKQRRIK